MSRGSEVTRLSGLGWQGPDSSRDGVRYADETHAEVSYPRGVLDSMMPEGGDGFWLDARALQVGGILTDAGATVLWDVGAGSGAMAKRLIPQGIEVVSVEPLPEGASECASLGGEAFCATLQALQLPESSIPAVGMFDVLEHIENPGELLTETRRVLQQQGLLVLTVPALKWLWSEDDHALGHYRRYTKRRLTTELESAGFIDVQTRYMFLSLVIPSFLARTVPYLIRRRKHSTQTVKRVYRRLQPAGPLNRLLYGVLRCEYWVSRWIPLPAGLSVVGTARKP